MTGWVILSVYLFGVFVTARVVATHLIHSEMDRYGDFNRRGDDVMETRLINAILGFFLGAVWPIVGLLWVVTWRLPKSPGQLRKEVETKEQRIKLLERQLGLND